MTIGILDAQEFLSCGRSVKSNRKHCEGHTRLRRILKYLDDARPSSRAAFNAISAMKRSSKLTNTRGPWIEFKMKTGKVGELFEDSDKSKAS